MHEVSLMQNALEIAIDHAKRQGAQRICKLTMRIGALSGVVPEALEFAFDVVAAETMAEGATFEIERVPVACYCAACDRAFEPPGLFYECPSCAQPCRDIRQGREMELVSMEVE